MSTTERQINDQYDVIVVGAGLAGLATSLGLAERYRVALVTKEDLLESNSRYAQGGIAAVVGDQDSIESHIQDTIISGAGLCDAEVVEQCIRLGPRAIERLVKMGVEFDRAVDGRFQLGKEGGHSHRRILHSGDSTGYAIVNPLARAAKVNENITLFTFHTVSELLRIEDGVHGVRCLNRSGHYLDIYGKHTILATGGCGQVFHRTTNPPVATGDGLAMALRADVAVKDLEFYQFHPTCLSLDGAPRFLVSEALRGEGGRLINDDGIAFMKAYDDRADLAPRDIVARAIHQEMGTHNRQVFLDMSHRSRDELQRRFPSIFQVCLAAGLDISAVPIPVSPAAHYACGGIRVDEWGNTNLRNLSAVGEVACTGLHGANRLASNSLLEAVVYAQRIVEHLTAQEVCIRATPKRRLVVPSNEKNALATEQLKLLRDAHSALRMDMWRYVSIVRDAEGLERARNTAMNLLTSVSRALSSAKATRELIEMRHVAEVSVALIRSAEMRRHSVGLHFRTDEQMVD